MTELARLYTRYKGLALAVGAGLILDDGADLSAETLRLAADAGRVAEAGDGLAARACHRAALDLHRLAASDPGAPGHADLIGQVRTSHQALRALLWDEIADQYAPCGTHAHRHAQEEHDHV
jgi:hypothetical protein